MLEAIKTEQRNVKSGNKVSLLTTQNVKLAVGVSWDGSKAFFEIFKPLQKENKGQDNTASPARFVQWDKDGNIIKDSKIVALDLNEMVAMKHALRSLAPIYYQYLIVMGKINKFQEQGKNNEEIAQLNKLKNNLEQKIQNIYSNIVKNFIGPEAKDLLFFHTREDAKKQKVQTRTGIVLVPIKQKQSLEPFFVIFSGDNQYRVHLGTMEKFSSFLSWLNSIEQTMAERLTSPVGILKKDTKRKFFNIGITLGGKLQAHVVPEEKKNRTRFKILLEFLKPLEHVEKGGKKIPIFVSKQEQTGKKPVIQKDSIYVSLSQEELDSIVAYLELYLYLKTIGAEKILSNSPLEFKHFNQNEDKTEVKIIGLKVKEDSSGITIYTSAKRAGSQEKGRFYSINLNGPGEIGEATTLLKNLSDKIKNYYLTYNPLAKDTAQKVSKEKVEPQVEGIDMEETVVYEGKIEEDVETKIEELATNVSKDDEKWIEEKERELKTAEEAIDIENIPF